MTVKVKAIVLVAILVTALAALGYVNLQHVRDTAAVSQKAT
jgi:hypothetical protein